MNFFCRIAQPLYFSFVRMLSTVLLCHLAFPRGVGDLFPVRGTEQWGLVQSGRVPVDQGMVEYIRHAYALTALTGFPAESKKRPAQKSSAS